MLISTLKLDLIRVPGASTRTQKRFARAVLRQKRLKFISLAVETLFCQIFTKKKNLPEICNKLLVLP